MENLIKDNEGEITGKGALEIYSFLRDYSVADA